MNIINWNSSSSKSNKEYSERTTTKSEDLKKFFISNLVRELEEAGMQVELTVATGGKSVDWSRVIKVKIQNEEGQTITYDAAHEELELDGDWELKYLLKIQDIFSNQINESRHEIERIKKNAVGNHFNMAERAFGAMYNLDLVNGAWMESEDSYTQVKKHSIAIKFAELFKPQIQEKINSLQRDKAILDRKKQEDKDREKFFNSNRDLDLGTKKIKNFLGFAIDETSDKYELIFELDDGEKIKYSVDPSNSLNIIRGKWIDKNGNDITNLVECGYYLQDVTENLEHDGARKIFKCENNEKKYIITVNYHHNTVHLTEISQKYDKELEDYNIKMYSATFGRRHTGMEGGLHLRKITEWKPIKKSKQLKDLYAGNGGREEFNKNKRLWYGYEQEVRDRYDKYESRSLLDGTPKRTWKNLVNEEHKTFGILGSREQDIEKISYYDENTQRSLYSENNSEIRHLRFISQGQLNIRILTHSGPVDVIPNENSIEIKHNKYDYYVTKHFEELKDDKNNTIAKVVNNSPEGAGYTILFDNGDVLQLSTSKLPKTGIISRNYFLPSEKDFYGHMYCQDGSTKEGYFHFKDGKIMLNMNKEHQQFSTHTKQLNSSFGYFAVFHENEAQSTKIKYLFIGSKALGNNVGLDCYDRNTSQLQAIDRKNNTKIIGGFLIDARFGNGVKNVAGAYISSVRNGGVNYIEKGSIKLEFDDIGNVKNVYGCNEKTDNLQRIKGLKKNEDPWYIKVADKEYLVYQNGDVFEGKIEYSMGLRHYVPAMADEDGAIYKKNGIMYRKNGVREIGLINYEGKLEAGKKIYVAGEVEMINEEKIKTNAVDPLTKYINEMRNEEKIKTNDLVDNKSENKDESKEMKKNNFINESDTKPKKAKKKKKKKEYIFGYADVYHQSKSQSNEVKYRYVGTKYDNDSNSLDSFDFDTDVGGNTISSIQQIDYKRHTKTIGNFSVDRNTGNIDEKGYWDINTIKLQFNKEEDKVIGVYGYNKKSKKITDVNGFDMTKNPDWIVLGDTEYLVYQNGDVFEGKCKFSNKYNCYIPAKSDEKGIMYRKNGDREIGDFNSKGKLTSGKKISWEGVVTMVEKEEKKDKETDNKTKEKKSATSMLDKPNTSKEQIDNSNSKMTTIKFANSNDKNNNNDISRKIDENKEKLKKVERVASDVKQSKKLNSEKEALIGFQVDSSDFN